MAKVLEIAEMDSSTSVLRWSAEVLRLRFEEVLSFRDQSLNSADIEGVHQMRVAIRRLRSALRDFSPFLSSPFLKECNKELKQLADTLGQARDQDVAIDALRKLVETTKSRRNKTRIEMKIEKLRTIREKTQKVLTQILDQSSLDELRVNFYAALRAFEETDQPSALTAREAGEQIISRSLREFCDLGPSLYDPFNCRDLHKLRIAAKRLRYAIELFTVFWGEKISPFAAEVANMQTYLGELHDCDIWIEDLSRRLRKEKEKTQIADFWLLSRFTKKRTRNYCAALLLWKNWRKNKFVKRLKGLLESVSEPCPES